MNDGGSVVPETTIVTEAEFHAAMLTGLSRCSKRPEGKRALAAAMDLSSKGLDNILLKGAMPGPKRLWDARTACPSALDDIAKLYGCDIVPSCSAAESDDNAAAALVAALKKVIEAEADGHKDHAELLDMEEELRAARGKIDSMLARIDGFRRPKVVA